MRRLLLLTVLALSSCTLFDSDPPPTSCNKNDDCFRAQGEFCNLQKHVCEVKQDAGVVTPQDAAPDAGVDAP